MASLFKHIFNGSKPENGELTINLNLTIKIEADGSLSVMPTADRVDQPRSPLSVKKLDEQKNDMIIPDFESGSEDNIIDFGKNV